MSSGLIKAIKKNLRRSFGLLRWLFASVNPVIAAGNESQKRLLMIYDYSSQPFSIGDVLIFQEISLVLRDDLGLGKVDFALVYDPARPVVPDPAFGHLDAKSFLFHLSAVLPAAQVNPYLGSLMLFDSHAHLESHVSANISRYHVWPGPAQYAAREYLYYECFNKFLPAYFGRHGRVPKLESRPAAVKWAAAFFERHLNNHVPVTVQLRRNPQNPARDSNYDAWLEFFGRCMHAYPAKFILICAHSEIDARFRSMVNVIIAKDLGTSVEQDLALIEGAAIHLGASSGPGTIAQFNDKPYCIFNSVMPDKFVTGFTVEGNRGRFAFSTQFQYWITDRENADLLEVEFERLWNSNAALREQPKQK